MPTRTTGGSLKVNVAGDGWKPALGVMGVTAALIALDPVDTPPLQRSSFQQSPAIHGLNHVLSGVNTGLAIAAVPAELRREATESAARAAVTA